MSGRVSDENISPLEEESWGSSQFLRELSDDLDDSTSKDAEKILDFLTNDVFEPNCDQQKPENLNKQANDVESLICIKENGVDPGDSARSDTSFHHRPYFTCFPQPSPFLQNQYDLLAKSHRLHGIVRSQPTEAIFSPFEENSSGKCDFETDGAAWFKIAKEQPNLESLGDVDIILPPAADSVTWPSASTQMEQAIDWSHSNHSSFQQLVDQAAQAAADSQRFRDEVRALRDERRASEQQEQVHAELTANRAALRRIRRQLTAANAAAAAAVPRLPASGAAGLDGTGALAAEPAAAVAQTRSFLPVGAVAVNSDRENGCECVVDANSMVRYWMLQGVASTADQRGLAAVGTRDLHERSPSDLDRPVAPGGLTWLAAVLTGVAVVVAVGVGVWRRKERRRGGGWGPSDSGRA